MNEIEIKILHDLCKMGNIKWTTHVLMRLQERDISPSDIKNCIMGGKIIEQYPKDYPYPSCLIFGFSVDGKILHVVVGVGNGFLWLVTAYFPTLEK